MAYKTYALVCGCFILIGFLLGWSKASNRQQMIQQFEKTRRKHIEKQRETLVPVVYAKKNIKDWTIISNEDIELRQIKYRYKPHNEYYKVLSEAVGSLVVCPIYRGEPIVKVRAIRKDQRTKCLFELEKGKGALILSVAKLDSSITGVPADVSVSLLDGKPLVQEARLLRSFKSGDNRTAVVELTVNDALTMLPTLGDKQVVLTAAGKSPK